VNNIEKFLEETLQNIAEQRDRQLEEFCLATAGSERAVKVWRDAGWRIQVDEELGYDEENHTVNVRFKFSWVAPDDESVVPF
jgi:hypothetical protein